jgi:TolB-like protein
VQQRHAPGERLGPYELVAPLGAGGMGEVWKALDTRLGRHVAVKFGFEAFSGRFLREARAIAALNHPNICTLHDVGDDFLVMELVEGTPPRGPLPVADAVRLAVGVCAALDAAHAHGIVHRDLKPGNVLVTASGVKLLDFGLAHVVDAQAPADLTIDRTAAGAVVGTVAYMSPEQARAQPVDHRSDIFAFGVLLYELLSGRQPFGRRSTFETLAAIVQEPPPPLDAPASLAAVVARCLEKVPAARFASMAEVRAALEAAVGSPAATRPVVPATPSLAVLPFANLSADPENAYFADGLAEEVLNLLARIPGLRVTARTSSFAFRDTARSLAEIAAALRVDHVLEGSVRRAGARIRVTAQLVSIADGSPIWSERFDRELTDVFALQDEIGQAIAGALRLRLSSPAQPMSLDAYQAHLRGRHHLLRLSPDGLARARECFEEALALDPRQAAAHSALAELAHTHYVMGFRTAAEVGPTVRHHAAQALALDPAHAEAFSLLASMEGCADHDWSAADALHRRALAAAPVTSIVRFRAAAWHLLPHGRVAEARSVIEAGLDTDPLGMALHYALAMVHLADGDAVEAHRIAATALDVDPVSLPLLAVCAQAQLALDRPHDAVATLERALAVAAWPLATGLLVAARVAVGDRERASALAVTLPEGTLGAACAWASLGDSARMFTSLEAAYHLREHFLPHVTLLAPFVPYHGDPRFLDLISRLGLAASADARTIA